MHGVVVVAVTRFILFEGVSLLVLGCALEIGATRVSYCILSHCSAPLLGQVPETALVQSLLLANQIAGSLGPKSPWFVNLTEKSCEFQAFLGRARRSLDGFVEQCTCYRCHCAGPPPQTLSDPGPP